MSGLKVIAWIEKKIKGRYFALAAIAAAALVAYCNSFTVPFLLDDFGSISNNYAIQTFLDFAELWKFYANRIVLYFTLSINYAIHDNGVEGYHFANLLIHIFNGIVFYWILKILLSLPYFKHKLISRYRNSVSLIAAILFVCHPIQVNAVTYIVQRTASLAATFYLLAIYFFLKYRTQDKLYQLLLTFLFTVVAMFTKENTITIPFMLLLIEIMFFLKDGRTSNIKRILMFLLLFITVPIIPGTNLLLQGYSQSDPNVTFKASTSMDRFQYFFTQLNVILLYIRIMFLPYGQNFDYSNDFPMSTTIWDNYSYISFIILGAIGIFSLKTYKRNRLISLGILWFFIGLAVESSFISIKDVYFEHRLYFPAAGFVMFIIGMIFYQRKKKKVIYNRAAYLFRKPLAILIVCSIILIPVYTGLTIRRNYIYGDAIRLWSDVVSKAPGSDRAHSVLGSGYLNEYDEKENNTEYLDLAEQELKKAIELYNSNSTAHANLSKVYLLKEEYEKCIDEAQRTIRIKKSEYAYFNMGQAYRKLGDTEKAIESLLKGYDTNSRSSFILKALGETYNEKGDLIRAKRYYEEYLENNKRYKNVEVKEALSKINEELDSVTEAF